jgi:hypothetical protein
MLPIFNDYCKFIYDKCGLLLEEGYYWLDNQIVKCFDTSGEIHKLYRFKVENDLSMTYKPYKKKKNEAYQIDSWSNTVKIFNERLDKLEKESITLLQQYGINTTRRIIDTNSTGKDSEVKTCLAKKAGLKFETYFNCTTMDVADSNKFAKQKGYKFTYPEKKYGGFYQWQKRENLFQQDLIEHVVNISKRTQQSLNFQKMKRYYFYLE